MESEQVDAGLCAAQAVGGRARVAAVLRQGGQLGGHLVAVILVRARHGGRAVAQGRAGPVEGGRRLPLGRAERAEGVRRAGQHREVDDPRGGCGRWPRGRGRKRTVVRAAAGKGKVKGKGGPLPSLLVTKRFGGGGSERRE